MKQEEILFFLGSVVVVVFAWIAFTVLHNSLTSTITAEAIQAIIPIPATFDTKIIDKMKTRTIVAPVNTIQPPSQTAIVVTSAPTPTIATTSAQTATTGGTF